MLCHESGHEFLSSLTAFTNLILAGGCPVDNDISPIFFGGHLLALSKKSGGVCPIAINFTLRHLASKCANSVGSVQFRDYFCLRQLGVGIPGGCEAAVHFTRRFLEALPADHVVVKMDFSNAFNSLHRVDMLTDCRRCTPSVFLRIVTHRRCSLASSVFRHKSAPNKVILLVCYFFVIQFTRCYWILNHS